ncbi:MAG: hypothetical protein ACR2G4_14175 [Pyrinomonadaceae bacterium]
MPFTRDNESTDEQRADARRETARHEVEPRAPDASPSFAYSRSESPVPRLARRYWLIGAAACLLAAAALLMWSHLDAAFVVATLGILAWFFDLRNRLRPPDIEADEKFADAYQDGDEKFNDRDER